jgi:hypothetical protein
MNLPLTIGIAVLVIITLAIVIEMGRSRSKKLRRQKAAIAPPRRSQHLERRMVSAFAGPRKTYGDCFAEFSIWRQMDTTRMDVRTKGAWLVLDLFTRSMTVRYLWQMLDALVKGPVTVNVDLGSRDAMVWSKAANDAFNDKGVVPPWIPVKGRVGTLISGP